MRLEPLNSAADRVGDRPAAPSSAAHDSDSERIERERAYHNLRFQDETRLAQNKYYAAVYKAKSEYINLVRRLANQADVLEYGCATGEVSLSLAPLCRSIIGIDISDVVVEADNNRAKQVGLSNIDFRVMNAEAMTFADNSFDLVFGSGIIHHLDIEKAYSEIARVLRPGGSAVFWEPLGHNVVVNLYRRLTPNARTLDEHPLLRSDLNLASRYFHTVDYKLYGLTTLATVPLRNTVLFRPAYAVTEAIDRIIFTIPGLRWNAWFTCLHLRK